MPQFWRLSHRRRQESRSNLRSTLRKPDPQDVSAIVLKIKEDEYEEENHVELVQSLFPEPLPPAIEAPSPKSDVTIIGAGPAGLMLATNLTRFGINVNVLDNRSDVTATGRADGLQPKSIETLRQMRLADRLLLKGVRVYDIHFWSSANQESLHRIGRDVLFPGDSLDTLDPYILLSHQGFVEDVLLKDMMERGSDVRRNVTFVDYKSSQGQPIEVICKTNITHQKKTFLTDYLVGCDGAHSNVRRAMGARAVGSSYDAVWGVLDGVLETDFPDLYSKVVIYSEEAGSAILLPRERDLTRLYIELKPELREGASKEELTEEYVMTRAEEIFEPYTMKWKSIEWFGRYQIGQKIASKFQNDEGRVFIAGDATHTNSPKASQGMNTSLHDSWNLAWKMNLVIRGLAKPSLLDTYEDERRQVAENLIDFDYEHAKALVGGDPEALAENFHRNVRFISGFGADYAPNLLNVPQKGSLLGDLRVGCLPPPAKVTRFVDSNPVDIQLDIPMLGQFRIYFFTRNIHQSMEYLETISSHALTFSSVMGRATCAANASYTTQPPYAAVSDEFIRPERYTPLSGIFTFAMVLQMSMMELEIADLPPLWREGPFTIYLDNIAEQDTRRLSCTEKWLGNCSGSEVDLVVLRPDGYVGTVCRARGSKDGGLKACKHLDNYFAGFLNI